MSYYTNNIKSCLTLTVSAIIPTVLSEVTSHIVDIIPKGISLMSKIPIPIVNLNKCIYTPYLILENQFNLSNFTSTNITGPIYEELTYRVGIQTILLNELPKKIFRKNQKILNFLDSKIAKISRTIITAYLFAALHYSSFRDGVMRNEELGNVSFVATFLGGTTAGLLTEMTGNPAYSIVLHCANNIFIEYS